jgi:hypothetical protein
MGLFGGRSPAEVKSAFESLTSELSPGVPNSDPTRYMAHDSPGGRLRGLFLSLCPGELDSSVSNNTPGALPAHEAMNCLFDEARTKKFLSGVRSAVGRLRECTSAPLHVVDAGCGPIPIMAIQAAWSDPNLHVTAIELNPLSVTIAKSIISALKLEDRITIIEANAITHTPKAPIDLLVSETISAGLLNEPVVQVMSNLSQYLSAHGEIVPHKIDLHLGVFPTSQFLHPTAYLPYNGGQALLSPNERARVTWDAKTPLTEIKSVLALTSADSDSVACAWLTAHLGGGESLAINESLITTPSVINVDTQTEEKEPLIFNEVQDGTRIPIVGKPGGDSIGMR